MLTNRYLGDLPADSRAVRSGVFLKPEQLTDERLGKIRRLNKIALARGQSLAQMAIAWVLRHPAITSALIGASRPQQIEDSIGALNNLVFSTEELTAIDGILA